MAKKRKGKYGSQKSKKQTPGFLKKIPLPFWIGVGAILLVVLLAVLLWPKTPPEKPKAAEPVENTLFSGGMVALQKDGKWGYQNREGEIVIPLIYEDAKPFSTNGMAAVKQDGKWGYINAKGELVVECLYEQADSFSAGFAPVQISSRWGYINESGMNVIAAQYEFAGGFAQNGCALVRYDGFYGYIDTQGNYAVQPMYDSASGFDASGIALVSKGGLYGCIDKTGKQVIEPKFTYLGAFASGLAPAKLTDGFGYVDMSGNFVIQPQYEYAEAFSPDGIAKVTVSGKYAFINTSGELITDTVFSQAGNFSEGFAVVTVDGQQGLLKTDGTYGIAPGKWKFPEPVNQGLLVFRDEKGLYGFLDTAGNVVIEPQFTQAKSFREDGYAPVQSDGKWGVVDKTGNWVVAAAYETVK